MNTEKAIKLLREMQEAWKLQITGDAFDALEMAITELQELDKNPTKLNNSNNNSNNSINNSNNSIKNCVKGLTACRVPEDSLISRQAAIDEIKALYEWHDTVTEDRTIDHLKRLPSAQPDLHYDEWCTDCKEYDQERHCCPRWNKVIRETLRNAQEIIYCRDCKHWKNKHLCESLSRYGSIETKADFYCGGAKRKTDG